MYVQIVESSRGGLSIGYGNLAIGNTPAVGWLPTVGGGKEEGGVEEN